MDDTNPISPLTAHPDDDAAIRVRGMAGVLATIRYQLGFRPAESLVLTVLQPDGTIECTARVDLPDLGRGDWRAALRAASVLIAALLARATSRGGSASLISLWGPPGSAQGDADAAENGPATVARDPASRRSLADLERACRAAGVPVVDAVWVTDTRWGSLRCGRACCPAEGFPTEDEYATAAIAEMIGRGLVACDDRDELLATIRPRSSQDREAVAREVMRLACDPFTTVGRTALFERSRSLLDLRAGLDRVPIDHREAGLLIRAADSRGVRDALIVTMAGRAAAEGAEGNDWVEPLVAAFRSAPQWWVGGIASLAGFALLVQGAPSVTVLGVVEAGLRDQPEHVLCTSLAALAQAGPLSDAFLQELADTDAGVCLRFGGERRPSPEPPGGWGSRAA